MHDDRLSTGVDSLDALLGGGFLPGTLTVIVGASGAGKTQLGLHFADAGSRHEGRRGVIFDLHARLDSQSHADYARRLFDWNLAAAPDDVAVLPARLLDATFEPGEYLHAFDHSGRRVSRRDLDFDAWHDWQAELQARLQLTIGFFYSHFVRGVQRVVVDGVEPVDRPGESVQFELFEYIYHQVLRKDYDWVARDLFRQDFRKMADEIAKRPYDHGKIACLLLCTSHETLLDRLIEQPLAEGDVLASANTLIYMGRVREGAMMSRALFIAKHRGSACADRIVPFEIDDRGIRL